MAVVVLRRSAAREAFEEQGLTGEALTLALELGAHERHASRVAAVREAAAAPYLPDGEPAHWGVVTWRLLTELNGSGGSRNMGGPGRASARDAWARGLGTGRSRARDGAAWTAAIAEAVGGNGPVEIECLVRSGSGPYEGPWLSLEQESGDEETGRNSAAVYCEDYSQAESSLSLIRRLFADRLRSGGDDPLEMDLEGVQIRVKGDLLAIGQVLNAVQEARPTADAARSTALGCPCDTCDSAPAWPAARQSTPAAETTA